MQPVIQSRYVDIDTLEEVAGNPILDAPLGASYVVKYNGSTAVPAEMGVYTLTVEVAEDDTYAAATITLGDILVLPADDAQVDIELSYPQVSVAVCDAAAEDTIRFADYFEEGAEEALRDSEGTTYGNYLLPEEAILEDSAAENAFNLSIDLSSLFDAQGIVFVFTQDAVAVEALLNEFYGVELTDNNDLCFEKAVDDGVLSLQLVVCEDSAALIPALQGAGLKTMLLGNADAQKCFAGDYSRKLPVDKQQLFIANVLKALGIEVDNSVANADYGNYSNPLAGYTYKILLGSFVGEGGTIRYACRNDATGLVYNAVIELSIISVAE